MALVVNDRVKETSTTTGTVTFTLDGAVTGFETFSSAIGNGNTTYYAIEIPNSTEFEVGLGTVSAGQLARTTVISSSNSDALVNFSAGTKNVFCTLPASKATVKDADGRVGIGKATPTAALEIGGDGDTNLQSFRVNASTNSEWFSVGVGGAGVVRFNSQGGNTRVGGAMDLGARMNIAQLSASSAALALAGGYANNILEVNSANSNLGGDVMVIDQNGLVGIGTTSPSTLLHLSSSDPQITITDTDGTGSQVIKAVTDDLTLDAVSSINLDADSGVITFKDGGTQFGSITKSGNDLRLVSSLSDGDLVFRGNDGGVGITALTLDMSEAGNATFNGDVTVENYLRIDNSGSEVLNITGETTYGTLSVGNRTLNLLANATIFLDDQFNEVMRMHSNGNIGIGTTNPSATLDVDGSAIFNESGAAVDFRVEGDTNANLFFVDGSTDRIGIGTSSPGTALHMRIDGGDANLLLERSTAGVTSKWGIKPYNGKLHFRDESVNPIIDNFTMTSDGYFGIGTTSPSSLLHLSSSDPQITITDTDGSGSQVIKAVGDDLQFDVVGKTVIDSDSGGTLQLLDGGTSYLKFFKFGTYAALESMISDDDFKIRGNDGGAYFDALTLDMSEAGAAIFNDKVILGANKVIEFGDAGETISGDGTDLTIASSNNTTIDSVGSIFLDADNNGLVDFKDGGTTYLRVSEVGNDAILKSFISDGNFLIKGNDGGVDTTALTFDMSAAGDATFNSNIFLGDNKKANFGAGNDLQIYHDGSLSYIVDSGTGDLRLESSFLRIVDRDNNFTTATFDSSGVNLRQNNAVKLTTTSTGIDVTGTAVTDGLTVAGDVSVDSGTIKLDGNYPTGTNNVAMGDTALDSIGTGGAGHNVAIGHAALTADNTGTGNVGIGAFALTSTVTGNYSTAIGQEALKVNTASWNNAIGFQSMLTSVGGEKNIAMGFWSLKNLGSNDKNVAIGHEAGINLTGGDNNIIIGHNAQAASATTSNQITLGDANITSLRIPGLASGASSGDVLTYDGTDITLSAPTGVSAGFAVAMAIAL